MLKKKSAVIGLTKNAEQKSIDSTKKLSVTIIKDPLILSDNRPPIYVVDNIFFEELDDDLVNLNTVKSITVLKVEKAIAKYGDKGKNGIVEITTKQNIKEKNTDNKKLNKSIESKKKAELDRQQALKDRKQAELDKQ